MRPAAPSYRASVLLLAAGCAVEGQQPLDSTDGGAAGWEASVLEVGIDVGAPDLGEVDTGARPLECGENGDSAASQEAIDALAGCEVFAGEIFLNSQVLDLTPLASLREVGRLSSSLQDTGTSLAGLEGLEEVRATMVLRGTRSLAPLQALRRVGVELILGNDPAETVELSALEEVGRVLRISSWPNLVSLEGLQSLKKVERLVLAGTPQLSEDAIRELVDRIEVEEVDFE